MKMIIDRIIDGNDVIQMLNDSWHEWLHIGEFAFYMHAIQAVIVILRRVISFSIQSTMYIIPVIEELFARSFPRRRGIMIVKPGLFAPLGRRENSRLGGGREKEREEEEEGRDWVSDLKIGWWHSFQVARGEWTRGKRARHLRVTPILRTWQTAWWSGIVMPIRRTHRYSLVEIYIGRFDTEFILQYLFLVWIRLCAYFLKDDLNHRYLETLIFQ